MENDIRSNNNTVLFILWSGRKLHGDIKVFLHVYVQGVKKEDNIVLNIITY